MVCHIQDDAFSIRAVAEAGLLDIKLKGFWTVATVEHFAHAAAIGAQALKIAGCPLGDQVTLVDNTSLNIQPQDVVQRFDQLIGSRLNTSRRTAVVVSSALLKLQAKRVGRDHRFFDDRETALRWLQASDG